MNPTAYRIPLTALLTSSDREVSSLMLAFALELARHTRKGFRNADAPTDAEIDRLLGWSAVTLQGLYGATSGDVEAMYDKPGTFANLVKRHAIKAADAGATPIIDPALSELRELGVSVSQRSIVKGVTSPLKIASTRTWIDPNHYRLSTRVWRSGDLIQTMIDNIVRYEFSQGVSPTRLAESLEGFLTAEGAKARTKKLANRYGRDGSYSARRLVRTEITRAHGMAVLAAADADPFTQGVRWNLGFTHPGLDACDGNAEANNFGLGAGVYPVDRVPTFPNHPHCYCFLAAVGVKNKERVRYDVVNSLVDVSGIDKADIVDRVTGFSE